MDAVSLFMWVMVFGLATVAYLHPEKLHLQGLRIARDQIVSFFPRIMMAILFSGFFAALIPTELVVHWLGKDSGMPGILLATLVGGFLPGGPILCFPMIAILYQSGAGLAPLVAFLTSWSVFAFYRMIAYEIPILGTRFAMLRLLSSISLPLLAGIFASILEKFLSI